MAFVCGVVHPEDLVQIPGTIFIIASSLSLEHPTGKLYLINTETRARSDLVPRFLRSVPAPGFERCPGPPSASTFTAHGLAIGSGNKVSRRLYVVNHGGRESVEVFDVDMSGQLPALSWAGCIVFPSNFFLNSVAPTPEGGLVITNLVDKADPERRLKMATGGNTGAVYRWQPGGMPELIAGSEATGNNGIEVGPDGTIYVAAWGAKSLLSLQWREGVLERKAVALNFLPDNLRWAPDGILLITGQRRDVAKLFEPCRPEPCRIGWAIARFDPRSFQVTEIKSDDGAAFNEATTALQVGKDIWIGSASDDRVAIIPAGD